MAQHCITCKRAKRDFAKNRNVCKDCRRDQKRISAAKAYAKDPSVQAARSKKYYAKHKDKLQVKNRASAKLAYHADPARAIARNQIWRQENKNRVREINKAASKKWRTSHPEQARAIASAKGSRRRSAEQGSARVRQETNKYRTILYQDRCSLCNKQDSTIDHIQPLALGGTDTWDNLTALCSSCNSQKSVKSLLEFMVDRL